MSQIFHFVFTDVGALAAVAVGIVCYLLWRILRRKGRKHHHRKPEKLRGDDRLRRYLGK